MEIIGLVPRILDSLEDGDIIRSVVAGVLRIAAVMSALGGFAAFTLVLKFSFGGSAETTLGGMLLGLLLLLAILVNAQILWCRAKSVQALGPSPFTVIPIVSILLRTLGESYAAIVVFVGIGSSLFMLVAGFSPQDVLGVLGRLVPGGGGHGFIGALMLLLAALVAAFAVLLSFYLFAELIVVAADIARNMRLLVGQTTRKPAPPEP